MYCLGRGALLESFSTVLIAELVGDKTLYTLGSLSSRFRPVSVVLGASLAFMLKMLAAVLLGHLIARLPPRVIAWASALVFFGMAIALWRKRPRPVPEVAPAHADRHAVLLAFTAIFLSEWGDPGQLAAATLVAQHNPALLVWIGATLAVMTKATLAALLGVSLRRWLPHRLTRYIAVVVSIIMGLLAAFQIEV